MEERDGFSHLFESRWTRLEPCAASHTSSELGESAQLSEFHRATCLELLRPRGRSWLPAPDMVTLGGRRPHYSSQQSCLEEQIRAYGVGKSIPYIIAKLYLSLIQDS